MPLPSSIVAALVVLGAAAGFAHLADDTPAAPGEAVSVVATTAPAMRINPDAALDTSNVDDSRREPAPISGDRIDAELADVPQDHECVLQTADDTVWAIVADTDPRCAAWWGDNPLHAPRTPPFDPDGHTPRTAAATSGGTCSEPAPTAPHRTTTATATPKPQPQAGGLVNVNTATEAQLDTLPGIGTVLAKRIVENRPYSTVDDLHRVARLPFSKVAPLVTV